MDWLTTVWGWLANSDNQKTLGWIGGGVATIAWAIWEVYKFRHGSKPPATSKPMNGNQANDNPAAPSATVSPAHPLSVPASMPVATMLAPMAAAEVQADWHELLPFLSVLLYLCSANREIHDLQGREFQPAEPRVLASKKKGLRVFAAEQINTWQVAWRIGAALDAAEQRDGVERPDGLPRAPTGRTVRPHLRRAHFHLFWSGKGRTEPRVKWLPPIPIKVTPAHEPTVVVHPVGERAP